MKAKEKEEQAEILGILTDEKTNAWDKILYMVESRNNPALSAVMRENAELAYSIVRKAKQYDFSYLLQFPETAKFLTKKQIEELALHHNLSAADLKKHLPNFLECFSEGIKLEPSDILKVNMHITEKLKLNNEAQQALLAAVTEWKNTFLKTLAKKNEEKKSLMPKEPNVVDSSSPNVGKEEKKGFFEALKDTLTNENQPPDNSVDVSPHAITGEQGWKISQPNQPEKIVKQPITEPDKITGLKNSNQVIDRLNGKWTSDHTDQSIAVEIIDKGGKKLLDTNGKEIPPLKIATWNVLNKCQDDTGKYGNPNNPWNINETPTEFLERKRAQEQYIVDILINRDKNDCIFLQETDFFDQKQNGKPNLRLPPGWIILQPKLPKEEFTKNTGDRTQKTRRVITLYNSNRIEIDKKDNQNIFPVKLTDKQGNAVKNRKGEEITTFTGFEVRGKIKGTEQKVSLINVHLDYVHPEYPKDIFEYQKGNTKAGYLTICGGDTNHAQGYDLTGLIGHKQFATNFQAEVVVDPQTGKKDYTKHSILHEGTETEKRYDGFFLAPPEDATVVGTETQGHYFSQDEKGRVTVAKLDPAKEYGEHSVHRSLPGYPWEPRRVTFDKIRDALLLKAAPSSLEKQQLLQIVEEIKDDKEIFFPEKLKRLLTILGAKHVPAEFKKVIEDLGLQGYADARAKPSSGAPLDAQELGQQSSPGVGNDSSSGKPLPTQAQLNPQVPTAGKTATSSTKPPPDSYQPLSGTQKKLELKGGSVRAAIQKALIAKGCEEQVNADLSISYTKGNAKMTVHQEKVVKEGDKEIVSTAITWTPNKDSDALVQDAVAAALEKNPKIGVFVNPGVADHVAALLSGTDAMKRLFITVSGKDVPYADYQKLAQKRGAETSSNDGTDKRLGMNR